MLPPDTIELRPGQVLGGKYVLNRMIGRGGMGVVWAGTNKRTGKRVALKVLRRASGPNSQAADLFLREASAASRVNHPNVVTVFDIIDHKEMACIVMELLDGEPLNEYLAREGPLSMEKAAALLLPAMRGVAAANARGVIHRDLKPHNIFLCVGPDGRLVTAKVLDFGNSLLMESESDSPPGASHLTPVGTPAYMAPEHIAGSTLNDQRVDVYGFGVVLFEALAGQHPFPGPSGPALLSRILYEPPLSLASLRPDLPREVIQLIERAMAKDPNDRFPNLDPFIRQLEDHLLPASPLPRSMTPLAGVPIFPLVESHSGVADAVVQVSRRTEDSERHETRALYRLGEKDVAGSHGPPGGPRITPSGRTGPVDRTSTEPVPRPARPLWRFLARPALRVVVFGGILVLVVWLSFPRPGGRSLAKENKPAVLAVPAATQPTRTATEVERGGATPPPLPATATQPAPAALVEPTAEVPDPATEDVPEPKGADQTAEKGHGKHSSSGAKGSKSSRHSDHLQPDGSAQAAPVVKAAPVESPPPVPSELLSPDLDSPAPLRAPSPPAAPPSPLQPQPLNQDPAGGGQP